ncbi:MAG TPA: hypothetical protein DEB06_11285 [Phycisphaerales bacterium]|nr:hypothetical protein [Phycisphaerales bacterium]
MCRNLIPALADKCRAIAPDYPGLGPSSMPSVTEFECSSDNLARVVDKFTVAVGIKDSTMCVRDYGALIGHRIANSQPERPGRGTTRPARRSRFGVLEMSAACTRCGTGSSAVWSWLRR